MICLLNMNSLLRLMVLSLLVEFSAKQLRQSWKATILLQQCKRFQTQRKALESHLATPEINQN